MSKEPKIEPKDRGRFNRLIEEMTTCVKSLGDYAPAFDDPLIAEIAKAIIYIEKAEQWLDQAESVDVAASATDIIAKRSAMMHQAIENLATNRKERLKQKSSTEVKDEIEKFVREIMGVKG
ncbi:MAG: hypothetical protein QXO32_09090 [Candidatus Bathyarchaeia archaeon]